VATVIPPAIGAASCVHAWLLRGFVECGLPDVTLGGTVPEGGAVNAENIRLNRGVEGVLLCFPGFEPGEEWVYGVAVAGAASAVHVRCRDTLFSQSYAGLPIDAIAARVLLDVRVHNEAFVRWRAGGGEVSVAESRTIGGARGIECSRDLGDFLERRYRQNLLLVEGPSQGWWIAGMSRQARGAQITTGVGNDPTYRLRAEAPIHDRPEYRLYAESLKTLGTVMFVSGLVGLLVAAISFTIAGYNVFSQRVDVMVLEAWEANLLPLLAFLGGSLYGVAQVLGGLRLRALRNLWLVRICAAVGLVPCVGTCWLVGLPLGAWVLWKLMDEKATVIFGRG